MAKIKLRDGTVTSEFNTEVGVSRARALAFLRERPEAELVESDNPREAADQRAAYDSLRWDLEQSQSLFLPQLEPEELQRLREQTLSPALDANNQSIDVGQVELDSNAQTGGELEWGPFSLVGDGLLVGEDEEVGKPEDLRANYNLKANESGRFFVEYTDRNTGKQKRWNFSLLPAIDNNLGINISSPISRGSGAKVPEARPGLMVQTVMKHKNLPIPGGTPIIQTIGPEMRVIQLVGTFLGNESSTDLANDRAITTDRDGSTGFSTGESALYSRRGESLTNNLDSYEMARLFDKEVVVQGGPVVLSVMSRSTNDFESGAFINFTYEVVFTGIKLYAVRSDRTYYALNALVTDYELAKDFAGALEIDRKEARKIAEDVAKQQEAGSAALAEEEAAQTPTEGEETQGDTAPSSDVQSLEEHSHDHEGEEDPEAAAEATTQTTVGSIEEPSMAGREAAGQYQERLRR